MLYKSLNYCSSSSIFNIYLKISSFDPRDLTRALNFLPVVIHFQTKPNKTSCFSHQFKKDNGSISVFRRNMSSGGFKRLPTTVVPQHYNLTFEPNWADHSYKGRTTVDLNVKEATNQIVLNALNFQVTKVEYEDDGSGCKQRSEINIMDNDKELLSIEFNQPLKPGSGRLSIEYRGIVADNLKGLFRVKYTSAVDGQSKYHYVTKFEPTYARACFPCWDEPALKATYDITLIVPKDLTALSNMPVLQESTHEKDEGKKIVKFERSVKMSTYVMAFAIGEFDYIEGTSRDGVLCRVYTPKGKSERGEFALDMVTKALPFYKDYFGVAYPLPKMDFLAVNEYSCGAMENWGLVIFRESALLLDKNLSSTATKQRVALVTTHETSHMWFGNLVTMEWWSDLFLNEGYATYMEFLCTDHILPSFKIWENFISDYFLAALELDGLKSSHPIQVRVEDPGSIGQIFDAISYDKGAACLRMLSNYIGEESFKAGVNHYLKKYQYSNAETEDLWDALAEKSGHPVQTIMPCWTKQMGYPILTVKRVVQNGQEKVLTMTYEKFWADASLAKSDGCSFKWIIPVSARKSTNTTTGSDAMELIDVDPGTEFELKVKAKPDEWVKINPDLVGYFRVMYPPEVLEQFIPAIKNQTMGPIDRLGILDDLFAAAKANKTTSAQVLQFLLAYENEDNYTVWATINKIVGFYKNLLSETELNSKFEAFSLSLFQKIGTKLGWDAAPNESPHNALLRGIALARLMSLKHQATVEEGQKRFYGLIKGESTIDADLKAPVYQAMVIDGDQAAFEELLKLYRASDLLEEKVRVLRTFGSLSNPDLITRIFDFGFTDEVTPQDLVILMISCRSKVSKAMAWELFKKNVRFFESKFPKGGWIIRWLTAMPEHFTTQEKAQDVEKFFQENKIEGTERSVEQTLEKIKSNMAWLERDYAGLSEFLTAY